MFLYFVLVACAGIASSIDHGDTGGIADPAPAILAAALVVVAAWLSGLVVVACMGAALKRARYRLATLLRLGYLASLVVAYAVIIDSCHWADVLQSIPALGLTVPGVPGLASLDDLPLIGFLLRLLPSLALVCVALHPLYRLERRYRPELRFRAFASFNVRMMLAPAPLLLVYLVVMEGVGWLSETSRDAERFLLAFPSAHFALLVVLILLSATSFPLVLRVVFGARRLRDDEYGGIRARLEALARAGGARYREILVWRTGGYRLPNALVTGICPWMRYVFLTDVILERMSAEEVEAVFAHELGHARNNHLGVYMLALAGMLCLGYGALVPVAVEVGARLELSASAIALFSAALTLLLLLGFLLGMLLFINRRFERQADIFGAVLAPPGAMELALYRIGQLVGGHAMKRPSPTHGSLESRIQFLMAMRALPRLGVAEYSRARRISRALVVMGVISLAAPLPQAIYEATQARASAAAYDAAAPLLHPDDADVAASLDAQLAALRRLQRASPSNPHGHFLEAILLAERGARDIGEAQTILDAYERAAERSALAPTLRLSAMQGAEDARERVQALRSAQAAAEADAKP